MKIFEKKGILKIISFIIFFIFSNFSVVLANNIDNQKEIIFVVDTSNSMKSFDKQNLVADEIKKIANFLTSDYKIGLVTYNSKVIEYANITDSLSYFNSILDRTNYTGYTNAGDALSFAINMFNNSANFKNIILVSDGEIVLQNENLTKQSNDIFKNTINIAKDKNIVIDTIALGELTEEGKKFNIFEASNLTNGQIFKCSNILKLDEISNKILFEKFKIKKTQVGVGNTQNGQLSINLPTTNLDKIKILLTSSNIKNINVNCKSESANVINGKNFAIVEIIKPYENLVTLNFNSNGNVDAHLLQEVISNLSGEIVDYRYEDNTVLANLNITLKNEKGNIFDNNYYNNEIINLNINDKLFEAKIIDSKIRITLDTLKLDENLKIVLNLDKLEQNFLNLKYLNLKLDEIKINELLENNENKSFKFLPLYIILCLLCLVIILILLKNKTKKVKYIEVEKEEKPVVSKNPYEYFGKLNIYVVNTKEGYDIAPQVFNLQRKQNNEKVSLKDILNACKLNIGDDSASNIIFEPTMNKALSLTNNSYSTIIKNGSLLTFEKSTNINFNEKISIILEDEVTEFEIHYKSLKPSEVNSYI
ncbi:MAG: VWA domain-containing protein [Clostridiales bacterium]|nr:VWA domain-containing protein [Clostridiales bacterium]